MSLLCTPVRWIRVKASQRNNNCKILNQIRHLSSYWLLGVMHTAELDSTEGVHTAKSDSVVGSTPQRVFRYFVFLTPRCDAHCGVWLMGCNCTPQFRYLDRNRIRKYFSLFFRGLELMSKISCHTPMQKNLEIANSTVSSNSKFKAFNISRCGGVVV